MNLRDFRIGCRLLLKEPGYSSAVVFGLAIGLAVCFLLLGLVQYSFTYNQQIADNDRAKGRDIGRLVGREFALLIAIGALGGLPLAWIGIERYLSGCVERAPMGPWPLVWSLALVGLVAVAATSRQALAAVRMSPTLARE